MADPSADETPADQATDEPATEPANEPANDPDQPSLDDALDRVEALEDQVDGLEAERQRLTNALARAQADYQNARKRAAREKTEARTDAQVPLVAALVQVLDDLRQARTTAEVPAKLDEGLGMVEERITRALEDLGVERHAPEPGEAYDPRLHEALSTEVSDEVDEGRVLSLLQAGYELDARLVRPALVVVSAGPDAGATEE